MTKVQLMEVDSEGAIDIEATNGGIGLRWNDSSNLWGEGGKIMLIANHNSNDSIVLNSTNGGIDILSSSDLVEKTLILVLPVHLLILLQVKVVSDSIKLQSTNGGIDILASGASPGEDIDIIATGSSVNITSTESDANAIKLIANTSSGGIVMNSGTSGLDFDSTGQINIATTYDNASSIVLTTSNGGIDISRNRCFSQMKILILPLQVLQLILLQPNQMLMLLNL